MSLKYKLSYAPQQGVAKIYILLFVLDEIMFMFRLKEV